MILIKNERLVPLELKILRILKSRISLSMKEEAYYINLEKGYQGEQLFDKWIEPLSENWIILKDLLLEINNTVFQVDSLLIGCEKIYIFEVKNYEGDFYFDSDKWYTTGRNEIKNPLLQVKRSETLLRQLLQEISYQTSIESYIVFVNPEFYLYQAPLNQQFIFPTQINRFIKKLCTVKTAQLNEKEYKFAKHLLSLNLSDSPYKQQREYKYDQFQKGIICVSCASLNTNIILDSVVCNECGYSEQVTLAVVRCVDEYTILFPHRRITTNGIFEWCKIIGSKKTIRRVLSTHLQSRCKGRGTYYIKK